MIPSSMRLAISVAFALVPSACVPGPRPYTDVPGFPLAVYPSPLELGTLDPGVIGKTGFEIWNSGTETLTVARVEASCPCVSATPAPLRVAPGTAASMSVQFDPSEEADFRGSLAVELTGKAIDDTVLFRTRVHVEIADPQPRLRDH
jgi:hypothetical protein